MPRGNGGVEGIIPLFHTGALLGGTYRMLQLKECTGFWWTPNNLQHQSPGRLCVEDGRARLYLTLKADTPTNAFLSGQSYEVIHGINSKGHRISLLNCFDIHTSWSSSGIESRKIGVNYVITGGLVPPDSSGAALFKEVRFLWPSLGTWFMHTGVQVEWDRSSVNDFTISYKARDPLEVTCDDGLNIKFHFGTDRLPITGLAAKVEFKEVVWVTATPVSPQTFNYFQAILLELQNLFSFFSLDYTLSLIHI